MAFPLFPSDDEVFVSSLTGKAYKYSELQRCWLRHQVGTVIDFIQKPISPSVNLGDFNAVNSNSSAELFVLPVPKVTAKEFNNTNLAFTYKYRTWTPYVTGGDYNSVSSNSSTELFVLPTMKSTVDEFNNTNLSFTYSYKTPITIDIGGDFNAVIGGY